MISMVMEQLAFAKQDGVVERAGIHAAGVKIEAGPAMATDNERILNGRVCVTSIVNMCFCGLKPSCR